ncbi:hypothetical protein FGB62_92g024 [Gracilaria domingensis]|nr:hypothetical protein FGB62_92g024 [Gracilaria domingensis]
MHLVWICLAPSPQLSRTALSVAEKTNPLEAWAVNNTHLQIKYFADLLKPRQPARCPLAFSLQRRLGIAPRSRGSRKTDTKACENARIVLECNDEQDGHILLCISNVRIISLQGATQNAEQETTFVLSHYLKKWEAPSLERAFGNTKPRTLKPRAADDLGAFASFMSFLVQTETVFVANEFILDHQKKNIESRLVMIVPYTSNIASICHMPYHVKPRTAGGSSLPTNYHQWRNWHRGGQAKRMNMESLGADRSPEGYDKLLSSVFLSNAWQESSDANDPGNPLSAEHGASTSRRVRRQVETEIERSTGSSLVPNTREELLTEKVTLNAKESSMKKSDHERKSSNASKTPKKIISDRKLRAPMTITKNGFRYKRVSVDRPVLNSHHNKSNPEVLGLSSKPSVFKAAKQVVHSSPRSRKPNTIAKGKESCPQDVPKQTGIHDRVLTNRRKATQRSCTMKAEQFGGNNQGSPLRLSKMADCNPREDSVLEGYSPFKEPSRRAISAFARIATPEMGVGSHSATVEEHRTAISSTTDHYSHERKSVLQSSVSALKSREAEKRPRSPSIWDGLQDKRREKEARWGVVRENYVRRRVNVQGKGRIDAEPKENSPISQRQKAVVSPPSHAAQEHCEVRYKGDGKKRISVDKAVLYGQREACSGDFRDASSCKKTDASKSNSESMGSLLTRATPEGQAVEPEDELKAAYEAGWNRSSPTGETLSQIIPSSVAVTEAIQQFDTVIGELSNPSTKGWEPIISNAMTKLSVISEQLIAISHSWPQVRSLAKWRLRDDDAIIASMQGEQKFLFSDEHAQTEAISGKLWKVVFQAFEQAVWLLMKLTDPNAKVSPNLYKKPEFFRRATTILSCAQVTAELASSVFDSSQSFRSALDSFFNSTLVHFAQASNHGNLVYWTRIVFEHFEKDLPPFETAGNPHTRKEANDSASSSSLAPQKDTMKDRWHAKSTSRGHRPDLSSKALSRNPSNLLPEKKRMIQNSETLRNHPAFRRGRVFVGAPKKKRKPSHIQPPSRSACPSNALDRLIHMGSLQSSLDAIKVPETRDHCDRDEAVEVTDDEADKALVMAPKSNPPRTTERAITLDAHGSSRPTVSTAHDASENDTANTVKLDPVRKRKLALRDDLRIQDQNTDAIVDEPKPKRPRREEQGPTMSLLNRLRNAVSKKMKRW